MKICITGITGYVGSQIARSLHLSGHELICPVRKKEMVPDEIKNKHRVFRYDLTKEIEPIQCDLLIHCAAWVSEKTLSFFLNKANIDGTRNIMNAVSEDAKVIFISCANVYNINKERHIEEEEIHHTLLTPYGRSKLYAENVLKNEFSERNITILRIQNTYGLRSRHLLSTLIKLYNNGKLNVPGELNNKVSLTSIDHLIRVISAFMDFNIQGISTYNVVDSKTYLLKDVCLALLSNTLGREVKLNVKNEFYLRIIAGLRTVLVPGNNITQHSIDLFSRDHVLASNKLKALFPDIPESDFFNELNAYKRWITDTGVTNVLKSSSRIYWL